MKKIINLLLIIAIASNIYAQQKSPIPEISDKLSVYFNHKMPSKIFISTDKTVYKPGETIWFRAFVTDINNQYIIDDNLTVEIGLYSSDGNLVKKDFYKQKAGNTFGDITIPDESSKGNYFLVISTNENPDINDLFYKCIKVNPEYYNQLQTSHKLKDSISFAGRSNLLTASIKTLSGEIQKNFRANYRLLNGDEIITEGKLKSDENGNLLIPFSIPEKTNGEPFFIELFDSRNELSKQIYIPSNIDPVEITFYPEGASLNSGINTKMGFTAFTKWGLPVNVEGIITDKNNQIITNVKTFTSGIGLFSLIANHEQELFLKTTGNLYPNQIFELPKSIINGLAVTITKIEPGFVSANLIFPDKQKHTIAITVTNGSTLCWAADMEINGTGRIKIPTDNFPQGVNILSVFDVNGNLISERLFFIDKNRLINIAINSETKTANQNSKFGFKVKLSDENNNPVSGNISVSVSEINKNEIPENNINTFLNIEAGFSTPFNIIADAFKTKITNTALLDAFLISNKTANFNWSKILSFNPQKIEPIDESTLIKGIVTNQNGEKIFNANVSLINENKTQIYSTKTKNDGSFIMPKINSSNYSIIATDPNGKRELIVNTDKKITPVQALINYIELKHRIIDTETFYSNEYFKQNSFLFPKATKNIAPNTVKQDNLRNMLSTATNLMDVIKTIKPYKIMNNQIVFLGSENSINNQGGALLVLDGQQLGTDISAIQNISPMEVDRINVSTNPMDIQRYTGLNSVGVVEIFLKRAKMEEQAKSTFDKDAYDGQYRIPNNFQEIQAKRKNNTSTTLLWIPDAKINTTGELEFTFNTGKIVSEFKIQVHAVSENGNTGSGSAVFSVIK